MNLPQLKIGNLVAAIPIIQGGMAVRISTAPLAAAVANAGGIGVIGGSGMGIEELKDQIKKAKELAPNGIIGVNIMFVAREFFQLVEAAISSGVDLIITGAGFSRDVFKYGEKYKIPIVSIVSSVKTAILAEKCGADAIIVEGKEAGGHLGTDRPMREVLTEVLEVIKGLPVIAAGGITNGTEIAELIKKGAAGVQMATRFVLSKECDVSDKFKQMYLSANKEDIVVFQSPVGLPGRALRNKFVSKVLDGSIEFFKCSYQCMKKCSFRFCIIESLINAQKGDIDNAIIFSGENVWKMKEILPVKDIFSRLVKEAEAN
ncbi:MAG: nitronate monooxygenase [Candidatus Margulisiibacteriota bacterium]|nr:MAG: 2-nitropropane dioxygenase [Candidatus Margulisbacteria bacterium GWD2_39_127]OGI01562.1 MAG: 2-nitropropane dioxygenase [Candidatus Margulisbacteria bacterium GWF2_38_17]OGI10003.1 MAG: 2-nitropropane dioxygenase [Candidatus Margulisbacteria bacterium GWE2_39_32]PZM78258.1 MAG: nitronate monooxygenase [Candidatus Margulisiibacteriota bacterium]HAR61854.1 2-nitropropane dioxygenase [Candidatus Margulisiibacteriota bacterium]